MGFSFIVLGFFILAVVALIVGQICRVELVLVKRSRGKLVLLRGQEIWLKFRGWHWQFLLDGLVNANSLAERIEEIAELRRKVFVFLVFPHTVDDLRVGFYFGLRHDFADELDDVVLESEDELGEKGVVLLLVFAGREAAVYRH